ncbi:serine protease inhibitor 27A-like [Ctenocephalides felis]|nr:serine protease inhibitor 27A-like [Ctenocephalides felis]
MMNDQQAPRPHNFVQNSNNLRNMPMPMPDVQNATGWDLGDDFIPFEGAVDEDFDWALYKTLSTKSTSNLLVSPVCVKLLLMMLYEGASGDTKLEILRLLSLPDSYQSNRERAGKIIASLKAKNPAYHLDFDTRIYISHMIQPRQRFNAIAKMFYDSDIVSIDFTNGINKNNSDGTVTKYDSATIMNQWVANVTRGHITELVNHADVYGAVMVLLNVIYFKGEWRKQFPEENTTLGKFYLDVDKPITVPFMRQQGVFFYHDSKELDARILRMPYKGGKFSAIFILPNTMRNGLQHLQQNLNAQLLRQQLWLMDEVELNVTLPKYKFDFKAKLVDTLKEMGLQSVFSPTTSSLPGIARGLSPQDTLSISGIMQKAGIEVNEKGSTVYAATEIVLTNKFGNDREVSFLATRPFMFFIQDETSGTILFIGEVLNPLETSNE